MTHALGIRLALGYLALSTALVGFWAQLAPQSFYDNFPGMGMAWISVDGPFNEHLIRDVGGLNLALMVLLIAASITLSRVMIVTAAVASLVYGVPHLLYHLFTTDNLETSDLIGSIGGLALFAALPLMAVWASSKLEHS